MYYLVNIFAISLILQLVALLFVHLFELNMRHTNMSHVFCFLLDCLVSIHWISDCYTWNRWRHRTDKPPVQFKLAPSNKGWRWVKPVTNSGKGEWLVKTLPWVIYLHEGHKPSRWCITRSITGLVDYVAPSYPLLGQGTWEAGWKDTFVKKKFFLCASSQVITRYHFSWL